MSAATSDAYPVFSLAALRGDAEWARAREAEWERVFAHFQPRLELYFRRRSDGILPLDDLLQEVWLRACLNILTLETPAALWTWFLTIGNNLLRDELRRRRPVMEPLPMEPDTSTHAVGAFLGLLEARFDEASAEALADVQRRVTAEEWEFLSLLCVDNLSHEEVAARVNLPSAMASRQRLRRLRERLVRDR